MKGRGGKAPRVKGTINIKKMMRTKSFERNEGEREREREREREKERERVLKE